MATPANSYYFRRRVIGRAASPPTWACYEQIPYDDDDEYSDSGSESCSEDEEDYREDENNSNDENNNEDNNEREHSHSREPHDHHQEIENMDIDDDAPAAVASNATDAEREKQEKEKAAIAKGKQRATDSPETPAPTKQRQRRKRREPVVTLRPILTIQRSQGFVWNQDLFVPPYIKDRYVASTSPPNSRGFISTSASSTNSALADYEVEVVEIRVKEGELSHIIP